MLIGSGQQQLGTLKPAAIQQTIVAKEKSTFLPYIISTNLSTPQFLLPVF